MCDLEDELVLNRTWIRKLICVVMDCCLCVFALYFSLFLRFEIADLFEHLERLQIWTIAPYIVGIHIAIFWLGGMYAVVWRLADADETLKMLVLGVIACALSISCNALFSWLIPRSVLALTSGITILASIAARLFWRILQNGGLSLWFKKNNLPIIMIVGAGETGIYLASRYAHDDSVSLIFVDDDPLKQGMKIHNVRVMGSSMDIPNLVKTHAIHDIIIAIPSLKGEEYTQLVDMCNSTKCHVRVLREPHIVDNKVSIPTEKKLPKLREINIEDFLSRDEVKLETKSISQYLMGKTVLVTGGGGSIGSEICRQVMRFAPSKLLIFDVNENGAYELYIDLQREYGYDCVAEVLIGSIRDKPRLQLIFEEYHPNVVFHAAAHKHVPLMEKSPVEAVKNNVIGTQNVLAVSAAFKVERFVQLSSDKAVNPTNVMGATKRVTELLIQQFAVKTEMKCMAVRFGNVLGSHGSVIPLFEAQIKAGGPVTVTHPDITRYFMTIPEAAQLVLQAGGLAHSGAIYVLDMGTPIRITELAEKMIRLYGYIPGKDMEIRYTGLRLGEKMHEELFLGYEKDHMISTAHKKITIAPSTITDEKLLQVKLERLVQAAERNDKKVNNILMEIVDTYRPDERVWADKEIS